MRRALVIAPELLADGRLDAFDKLTAALIDTLDGGSGTDEKNEAIASVLGASVSKAKQCIGNLITAGIVRHRMVAGNERRLHSDLAAYVQRRRAELGWAADATPASASIPTAGVDTPSGAIPAVPSQPPPQPPPPPPAALAAALTAPEPPSEPSEPFALFAEDRAEPIGPTDEEIWAEYPKKLEKPEGMKWIAWARKTLEKELKAAGVAAPKRTAAERLLAKTREWAAHTRARWAAEPWKGKVCIYAQRFYKNRYWDDEARADWPSIEAVNRGNGSERRSAEQRGQFPERNIGARVEVFGGGGGVNPGAERRTG
jgi:hypothetical protein